MLPAETAKRRKSKQWSLLQKYELWFDRLTTNGKGVRQAHHEWNNQETVHPEPRACRTVEGCFWSFARGSMK